jgi:VanZ family protein
MKFLVISVRLVAWLLLAAIAALSLCPPQLRPETMAPHDVEHVAIFAACGFAFGLAYYQQLPSVIFALASFSAGIELSQVFIPGRHARLTDFVVDTLAICISAIMAAVLRARVVGRMIG